MLPVWDKLQDLRGGKPAEQRTNTEVAVAAIDQSAREVRAVTSEKTIRANAERLAGVRQGIKEGKRMSKLAEAADRIAKKKQVHDAKGDEWAARLDAIDKREPEAFAMGDAVISERETDLTEMERTMRTLSNLPNVVSGT